MGLYNPNLTPFRYAKFIQLGKSNTVLELVFFFLLYCRVRIFSQASDSISIGAPKDKLTLAKALNGVPKKRSFGLSISKIQTVFGPDPNLGSNILIWLLRINQFDFAEKIEQLTDYRNSFSWVCRWAWKYNQLFDLVPIVAQNSCFPIWRI